MTFKHLVLGSGGPVGFMMYGALKELNKNNVWNIKDIESIYATSVGSWLATILLLDLDWEWIDDFLIKRPLEKLANISKQDYLKILNLNGIIDSLDFMTKYFKPLFMAKDIDINITLKEFYDKTKVDLYIYTVNMNTLSIIEEIELSHKSHPDLSLIKAISMSSCVPFLFKPIIEDDKCYLDGAILKALPINSCLNRNKLEETLIFRHIETRDTLLAITDKTYVIDYIRIFISKILYKLIDITKDMQITSPYTVDYYIDKDIYTNEYWFNILNSKEERELLINTGIECGKIFHKRQLLKLENERLETYNPDEKSDNLERGDNLESQQEEEAIRHDEENRESQDRESQDRESQDRESQDRDDDKEDSIRDNEDRDNEDRDNEDRDNEDRDNNDNSYQTLEKRVSLK